MLNKVSIKSAELLLKNCSNNKYEKEVYVYGIELIISTCLALASIIMISIMLGEPGSALIFIIIFSPLRLYAGGYHSETYGHCFIISNLIYVCLYLLNEAVWKLIPVIVWYLLLVSVSLYIAKRAPVINKNQLISEQKQQMCKKNIRYILLIDIVIAIYLMFEYMELASMAVLSVLAVAFLMFITDMNSIIKEGGIGI